MEAEQIHVEKTNNKELSLDEKIEIYEEILEKCSFDPETQLPKAPLLKKEEEVEFAQRIEQGEERYKDYFLVANLRLVAKKANDYYQVTSRRHNLEKKDLIQYGTIGLMIAIEKFDYKKDYKFSTYADWWIKNNISRAIEEKGRMIRYPIPFAEKLARFRKCNEMLHKELSEEPSLEQISQIMNITTKEAHFLKDKNKQFVISLNSPNSNHDGDIYWEENLEDINSGNPEEIALRKSYQREIRKTIEELDERDKHIVKERFGFNNHEGKTLDAIGQEFGLTRERVRQIEEKILERIKVILIKQDPHVLEEVMENYEESDREILEFRFGLKNGVAKSKKITAKMLGINITKINEIEKRCLKEIVGHYVKDMS